MSKKRVSEVPEFQVHVYQLSVRMRCILIHCHDVFWYFLIFYCLSFHQKKFSWNNKMIPLLGIMNKNWKWQNHAFYYSLILSFELYNFIEVMPSVLMAVIKVESFISLSCINCLIKMTQP